MSASARRAAAVALAVSLVLAGCALYSEVSIGPLILLPTKIDRGADIQAMVRKADYLRALEMAASIESRQRQSATDLVALAYAELAAARYDAARQHLRAAIALKPFRTLYADAAWQLSQIDYMTNNFATSLEWAEVAGEYGLTVQQWHLQYLRALSNVPVYRFEGVVRDELNLHFGRPDLPRIDARVNDRSDPIDAVIDSGAVLSIMSDRLAAAIAPAILDVKGGTFYGLLGEAIPVRFALLESLHLGLITIRNVPVAVMPDDKMRFIVSGKREFSIDFLLGANLLKEFRLELDFARHRAIFTRLLDEDRRPAANQNLFFESFRPVVRGAVQRHGWFMFIVDTGSEVTYLNEAQVRSLPIDYFAPRVHSAVLQGLGGAKKHGTKLENVEIGVDKWAGTFKTIPMYSGSENERAAGIIGQNFLKNFRVVMDFGTMRLDLERR
ncbi:MAG TPA: retroviral-like aspartic protease family protein [Thermoanaerobaculia bacterium]|nr:retroviral-like aspartic protease family protein [Thermoanaerobaculia bacterium]